MTDKFSIKDYFNYSISGFLWILILLKFLDISSIYSSGEFKEANNFPNSGIYFTISLLFVAYILGNILRFSELFLIFLTEILYGDLYSTALCSDIDTNLKESTKVKLKVFGLCHYLFKKKPLGIGLSASILIENNLKQLNIYKKSKKNQHLMCETYLLMKYSKLKYERLKNLKNFYESISFPLFVIVFWISIQVIGACCLEWYYKSAILILLLITVFQFIIRYKYLKSNYIKDIYRYFLFDLNENNQN